MSVCTVFAGAPPPERQQQIGRLDPQVGTFGGRVPDALAHHEPLEETVRRQTIGAVQTGTGNLTRREQSGHLRPPVHIGDDAPHE